MFDDKSRDVLSIVQNERRAALEAQAQGAAAGQIDHIDDGEALASELVKHSDVRVPVRVISVLLRRSWCPDRLAEDHPCVSAEPVPESICPTNGQQDCIANQFFTLPV